jgi:hypothetical protein
VQFYTTIIPAVLESGFVKDWIETGSAFIKDNPGFDRLLNISAGLEPSKSQAKYKWISMMHYLHFIKVLIQEGLV